MSVRSPIAILVFPFFLTLLLTMRTAAQDISAYELVSKEDVFQRELNAAVARAAMSGTLPHLDCAVEYIRRQNGEDVVYRRGPIDLHQEEFTSVDTRRETRGTQPAASDSKDQVFRGGILVDLPRAGETDQELALAPRGYRYMLRVALVPTHYENATLNAQVFLERAVVTERDGKLILHSSEVFSRTVELQGNLPLKFDLPEWDASLPEGGRVVPSSLQEAALITLEVPRHFGLPENLPEPFAESTLLTYAVPQTSMVRLSIQVQGGEKVIEEGMRQPGTYEVVWNAAELPDEDYTAVFSASDADGNQLYHDERTLSKSHDAQNWTGQSGTVLRGDGGAFVAGLESGVAYQFPRDDARALRNMFTHVVFRLGYRFSSRWEVGVILGQEAFQEVPGREVDIERISDYGGVVGYTYGYGGAYLRWMFGTSFLQPYVELGAGLSSVAALTQIAAGVKADLMKNVEVYLSPAAMMHFRSEVSTKFGIHYGMSVRF
ncbi:MAG: hypothetical protein IH600_11460 [Bacteroidetes bacterium]|nr:hypothetical protein [Bacteroidota bacterium]